MNPLSFPADGPRMERSEIRGGTRRHATLLELGLATPRIHHGFVNGGLQKYFASPLTQISSMTPDVLTHRGAYRDRHGRGMGCGGRGSARAHEVTQGGFINP